jgi:purine-nucleoside phosphorylase
LHAGSKELTEATRYLNKLGMEPETGVVLGTGLGDEFVKHIQSPVVIPYNSIPYFPVSTVSGHRGQFVYGQLAGKKIVAMQGRIHYYEGYPMAAVTFPVRVMHSLGASALLISNAAGNLNADWRKGDFMLIKDHIDAMPANPLRGLSKVEKGKIFLEHREMYDRRINELIVSTSKKMQIKLHQGIYIANPGPAIETKAEYNYLRFMGGDAVGMSTVPEVLMANYLGLRCAAVSVLTNDTPEKNTNGPPLTLEDVIKVASGASRQLTKLFIEVIQKL